MRVVLVDTNPRNGETAAVLSRPSQRLEWSPLAGRCGSFRVSVRGSCHGDVTLKPIESHLTMTAETVWITGGFGCIGAETTKWLLRNTDARVVVTSRRVTPQRVERVFEEVDRSRLLCREIDVRDLSALQQLLEEQPITRVAHLAALQTPDCNAHRDLGLQINLAGTQNLIEAIKASGRNLNRFVFASSVAVYGPRAAYPPGQVPMLAELRPVNVYGAWKVAGEHIARLFSEETDVPTLSLRPGVLYGPGRDAGLTASPTTAMKCVALNQPYEIPFRSRQDYLYAPDVGGAVAHALLEPFEGHAVFTLPSWTRDTEQVADALHAAAKSLGIAEQYQIRIGEEEVPFICDLEFAPFLEAFPQAPHTPLDQAVRESLAVFQQQVRRGWLTPQNVGS